MYIFVLLLLLVTFAVAVAATPALMENRYLKSTFSFMGISCQTTPGFACLGEGLGAGGSEWGGNQDPAAGSRSEVLKDGSRSKQKNS